ncbi:MAG: D-alanyl-D-alanine carboxypeptidase family protein [Bacillota bacterium]|jgi:D-alanyl-D-alanine carboxypeptidase (penicillin-binding protein 5/6)
MFKIMFKVKSLKLLFGSVLLLCFFCCQPVQAAPFQVGAAAAVLIDAASGEIIYEKAADQPLPPASCGKILTALTVMDLVNMDEVCTVSERSAAVPEASFYLEEEEKLTVEELLWGALVKSGNDACYALAEQVSGSEPLFVYLLNLKAAAVGAGSAELKNTNGLPAEGHQITAYDLALCTRQALQDQLFREIVKTKEITVAGRRLKNTNKLLWQDERIIGVKTGTTDKAGACLVAAIEENGRRLIAVVFDSPSRYEECLKLLEYGLAQTDGILLAARGSRLAALPLRGQKGLLPVTVSQDFYAVCQKGEKLRLKWSLPENISAPVAQGEAVGRLELLTSDGQVVAACDLLAQKGVKKRGIISFFAEKITAE